MTTQQLPQSIQASIHQDAIQRVSEFFNASTKDIMNELLQNARRSGASQVEITMENGQITVSDDGQGITDPAAILAFGQTEWDRQEARDEHPAGMGLYALARRELVTIRSKTEDQTAWQVRLTPGHFVGQIPAPIERLDGEHLRTGTTVAFTEERPEERIIQETARFYPLPVFLNGVRVEQEDFLARASHITEWNGVRIGVYTGASHYRNIKRTEMNFHGIIVGYPELPDMESITLWWSTQADVRDCPQLELTLPARREVVENQFMDELRQACQTAIYQAMTLRPEPVDVPWKVQQDAALEGIPLPDATPKLKKWEPEKACYTYYDYRHDRQDRQDIGEDPILMDLDILTPDQQALARAAAMNGIMDRLFAPDQRLEGYGWYDRMTRAAELNITVTGPDGEHNLKELRDENKKLENDRPDRITFTITTETLAQDGNTHSAEIPLPSDMAFEKDEDDYQDEVSALVTQDSSIRINELASLLLDAFFSPSDDKDADSFDTQEHYYQEAYERTATILLSAGDEAIITNITKALDRHVRFEVPQGKTATIQMMRDKPIQVTLEDSE